MTDRTDDLAETLTQIVVDIPGVRGIYPQSVVAAAVAGLVRSNRSAATGLLSVERMNSVLLITARLAIDATTRTHDVLRAVNETLHSHLIGHAIQLRIEIAHIS